MCIALASADPLGAQCAGDGSPPPCIDAAARRAGPPPANSVAVLPFATRSPDTSDAYLAEGLTDEITNQLSRLGVLVVRSRSLVAAQWRRTPDPMDAARNLNVAWVVNGYVRLSGERLLVNAELIRVRTGEEAWASRFARSISDVFAVQAEVAESLAVVVAGRLTPGQRAIMAARPTRNAEAYRLFLLGRSLLDRRARREADHGLEACQQATRLDAAFAAAWACVAEGLYIQSASAAPEDSRDVQRHGIVAADSAIRLDSMSAAAWAARALYELTENPFTAWPMAQRAIRLDSLDDRGWAVAHQLYSRALDFPRAEAAGRRALALNPDRVSTWYILAGNRAFQGRLREALAIVDTALFLSTTTPGLFLAQATFRYATGDAAGAIASLDEAERIDARRYPDDRVIYRVPLGDSVAAREQLAQLEARADTSRGTIQRIAALNMALGRREQALSALERLASRGPNWFSEWQRLHLTQYSPLRGDPRFRRLLESARPRVPWGTLP